MPDGELTASQYDSMGIMYRAASDEGPFNAYYERPATIAPIGDVTGKRVLEAGGAVVFSTHHPAMDWQLHSPDDCFKVMQVTETWHRGSQPFEVTFWRRPLTAVTAAISSAGIVIERLVEPAPLPSLQQRDPQAYDKIRTRPRFLFFRLVKRGAGRS
jgi:hypothetical protein